jgi:hypothetical protein
MIEWFPSLGYTILSSGKLLILYLEVNKMSKYIKQDDTTIRREQKFAIIEENLKAWFSNYRTHNKISHKVLEVWINNYKRKI